MRQERALLGERAADYVHRLCTTKRPENKSEFILTCICFLEFHSTFYMEFQIIPNRNEIKKKFRNQLHMPNKTREREREGWKGGKEGEKVRAQGP